MAIDKAPRRIVELDQMSAADMETLKTKSTAATWHIAIDFKDESNASAPEKGTLRIPLTKVAISNGNDYYVSSDISAAVVVNSTASNIPLATGTNIGLSAVIDSNNRLTKLTGLVANTRYVMNLQLECTPNVLSANIVDVSVAGVVTGSTTTVIVPTITRQMDMSGPDTSTVTCLEYNCEFVNGSSTELEIKVSAEEAITVKTTRLSVVELQ